MVATKRDIILILHGPCLTFQCFFNSPKLHHWCNVSVLASFAIDLGCELWSAQTKDYEFDICCFSALQE